MMRCVLVAILIVSCGRSHDEIGLDAGNDVFVAPPLPTDALDLLLVIDNSGSMGEEQAALAAYLPLLLEALASGDADGDGEAEHAPMRSVQVGVVTTDMGTGGFTVPTCARAEVGDDAVLSTAGNVVDPACEPTYSPVHLVTDDVEGAAIRIACVATVGVGGCGFEQQLEAMLKALSPSAPTSWTAPDYDPPFFVEGTTGHGGGGLVRDGSVLAVVIITDEEDCSASDPSIFDPTSTAYSGELNLRCHRYADQAVHPVSRYVEGLLELRLHPRRVVYGVISGIPTELEGESYDAMLEDPRMQEVVDPLMPNRLTPSCNVPGRGLAFAPRRMVSVARELQARGAHTSVGSICQQSFAEPLRGVARAIFEARR